METKNVFKGRLVILASGYGCLWPERYGKPVDGFLKRSDVVACIELNIPYTEGQGLPLPRSPDDHE